VWGALLSAAVDFAVACVARAPSPAAFELIFPTVILSSESEEFTQAFSEQTILPTRTPHP
jgi:hypothetical protein